MLMNERGDTLIEVIMAMAILTGVLLATYSVSIRAFHAGTTARERQQVSALMEEQAEALRQYRDNSDWPTFEAAVVDRSSFHMESTAGGPWAVQAGKVTGVAPFDIHIASTCNPADTYQNDDAITDKCTFVISGDWPPDNATGPDNHTAYTYILVNNKLIQPQAVQP